MGDSIEVQEQGTPLRFTVDEMLRYSGPHSPGGVALGFKLMERAFALLEPQGRVERREVLVRTAFGGPGVRDAFELVTRALTDGRYVVDPALGRPERGDALRTFAFTVGYRDRTVSLLLREGFVTEEFGRLAQSPELTAEEKERFTAMKQALADQLMAADPDDVFDLL
ncbi:MAG TPA: hypothetical protein VHG90_02210 [Acidimicrobiales bacterium]|nr:hypothetical protein [Acidimicrobiales bacterium]